MPFALPFIAGASKDLDLERLVSKNGGLFAIGFFKLSMKEVQQDSEEEWEKKKEYFRSWRIVSIYYK